jgi:hypothetical protein
MAKYFQATIVNFVRYQDPTPTDSKLEPWDLYTSSERRVMNFGTPGQDKTLRKDYIFKSGNDRMDKEKCAYWQSAPYYHQNDPERTALVDQNEVGYEMEL